MDAILFQRLRSYVIQTLGPTFQTDLSKLAVCVMQFVENKIITPLEGNEKLSLCLTWIEKLLNEVGVSLAPELSSLMTGFISRICEATKGQLDINTPTTSGSVTTAPLSASTSQPESSLKKSGSFTLKKKAA
jgi:hypothetical protein